MKIIINNSSMVPIYEQNMEQIKAQIISEELKENDILPSVRTMAKELKISALTVKKAYDNLEAAIQKGRRCGMKEEEIRSLFELIMEDE